MTIAVDLGRKATKQTNKQNRILNIKFDSSTVFTIRNCNVSIAIFQRQSIMKIDSFFEFLQLNGVEKHNNLFGYRFLVYIKSIGCTIIYLFTHFSIRKS